MPRTDKEVIPDVMGRCSLWAAPSLFYAVILNSRGELRIWIAGSQSNDCYTREHAVTISISLVSVQARKTHSFAVPEKAIGHLTAFPNQPVIQL